MKRFAFYVTEHYVIDIFAHNERVAEQKFQKLRDSPNLHDSITGYGGLEYHVEEEEPDKPSTETLHNAT